MVKTMATYYVEILHAYRSIHNDAALSSRGGDSNLPEDKVESCNQTDQFQDDIPTSHSSSESSRGTQPLNEEVAICSGNLGQVVMLKMNRKLLLLINHFIPPQNYKFPPRLVGGLNRQF